MFFHHLKQRDPNRLKYTSVLKKVIFVYLKEGLALDLSKWKYSLELVNRELDLTKKKKKALENLYGSHKISQSTYNYIENELTKALNELDDHLKTLRDKMSERAQELEKQISILEVFLASLEIHYAAGDVEEETYEAQNNAIILGLEATKQEFDNIKSSLLEAISEPSEAPTFPRVETAVPTKLVAITEPEETRTEATEVTESMEVAQEEEPKIEEQPTYVPTGPIEPSVTEPEPSSTVSQPEEPSEQPTSEPETSIGY
jgi:hypothetical protein